MLHHPNPNKLIFCAIIIGLCIALFSPVNSLELRGEEPRRAAVAMEMAITGEYIVPKINGWNYYNKPPLFNWLIAGLFKVFGSYDEWLVRVPSLVALLLTALANYFFTRKYLSEEVAVLSSFLFLTAGDIFFYGTQMAGEIDLFFSLLVYLQVILIFHFSHKKQYLLLFTFTYILTALGVLTKGLPSIAFQGITLLMWFVYKKQFRMLFHWTHMAGILCFVLITGLYFYSYSRQEDVIPFMVNLLKESSQRSAAESKLLLLVSGIVTYPINLLKFLLPWSLLVGYLFSKKNWQAIKTNEALVFCTLFFLANIPLYWFTPDAKSRYIYMFFPFLMILFAHFRQLRSSEWLNTTSVLNNLFTMLVIAVPLASLMLPWIIDHTIISHAIIKGLAISLLSGYVAWLFVREKSPRRIYYVVLSLVIARIGMNLFYLPSLNQNSRAMANQLHVEKMIELTAEKQFYLSGLPNKQSIELSFGPFGKIQEQVTTAPLLSYTIPYYYTKKTHQVLQFEDTMKPGKYYLLKESEIGDNPVDTLYTFQDNWTKIDMAMVISK